MKDQILTIACVVALGVGVLIGHLTTVNPYALPPVPSSPYPSNYDPARSIANDAMKSARDSEQNCWAQLTAILIEKKAAPTETTH